MRPRPRLGPEASDRLAKKARRARRAMPPPPATTGHPSRSGSSGASTTPTSSWFRERADTPARPLTHPHVQVSRVGSMAGAGAAKTGNMDVFNFGNRGKRRRSFEKKMKKEAN